MRKKLQIIKRNLLGAKEELDSKLGKVDQVDKQLDVAEVGVTRRRSRMITLQEKTDAKEEILRKTKLQLMQIDEDKKRNSFIEDLEQFEDDDTLFQIDERSQLGFADILKLSQRRSKTPSLPKQRETKYPTSRCRGKTKEEYMAEYKKIKDNFSEYQSRRNRVEKDIEANKVRIRRVGDKLHKETKRINFIQENMPTL